MANKYKRIDRSQDELKSGRKWEPDLSFGSLLGKKERNNLLTPVFYVFRHVQSG